MLKHPVFLLLALSLFCGLAGPGRAASSAWVSGEGARMRLLTTGAPDRDGILSGALEIELQPGWKTYWVDPGDAGVPPSVDVSGSGNVQSVTVSYPAPTRFDDGFVTYAGYDGSVTFPLAFRLKDPARAGAIQADIFLGVCETICVPFQARLTVDPGVGAHDPGDAAVVRAALGQLPEPAQQDFGVSLVETDRDRLRVKAAFNGEAGSTEFFIAGSEGYQFGPPERTEEGSVTYFDVPILSRPKAAPDGGGLLYVLTSGGRAVAGMLPYPQ